MILGEKNDKRLQPLILWCDLIIQRGLSCSQWCLGNVGPSGLVQYVDSFIRGTSQHSLNVALPKTGNCCTKKAGQGEHKGDKMLASLASMSVSPASGHPPDQLVMC